MKHTLVFIIIITLSLFSCKKNSGNSDQQPQDKFSFIYNSITYYKTVTNNISNASIYSESGNPAVFIDMPAIFGGRIFFIANGCAYLEPGNKVFVISQPGCQLSTTDDSGNPGPIDSVQAYLYESGSLNVSFSNCQVKSGTDFVTGLPYSYHVCRASGTFDLTLINKNNQTIKITNGVVDEMIQY